MPEPRDRPIEARQIPSWVPFFNLVAKPLLKLGVPMGPDVLITVRGRKTGLPRTTPVTICEYGGRRGFISPFGEMDWGAQPPGGRHRHHEPWTAPRKRACRGARPYGSRRLHPRRDRADRSHVAIRQLVCSQRRQDRHRRPRGSSVWPARFRNSEMRTGQAPALSSRCSRSCAASSISLWRHSAALYWQAIRPARWTRRKSP